MSRLYQVRIMMAKFKGKYRVESARLEGWDYASPGWYFVTICVNNHALSFGNIRDGVMHLSPLGEIAHRFLADIPLHFSHTEIDTFVVMPNHVHAIFVIRNIETAAVETPAVETPTVGTPTVRTPTVRTPTVETTIVETPTVETPAVETPTVETPDVETPHVASLQREGRGRSFGSLKPGSLSKIIQAYKAAVTRQARMDGHIDFTWQERFYDHIIRDESSLEDIRKYVLGNPGKWENDKYYMGKKSNNG